MTPKVLICDNEAPLRALVRATLSGGKYTLVEAKDGDEALALARTTRPDLLVLDMMMPGRSGLDVLTEIRRDPELDQIAVVLLTARTQAVDRAAAEAAGADYFLAKPFSPLELMRIVDDLLAARYEPPGHASK
jgi:two-component system phosphate regulon response regulator PhoB